MSDRLEWAHVTSGAELLYPGTDIDGAIVKPGEMAVAVWTGSKGIALHGPQQQLADRLEQLADAVRSAPPAPQVRSVHRPVPGPAELDLRRRPRVP